MTRKHPEPAVSYLHKILVCDPRKGVLTWKPRDKSLFLNTSGVSAAGAAARWNSRYANQPAFRTRNSHGYLSGRIDGNYFLSHRVMWAMCYGEWPSDDLDHINHKKDDNRISNLRVVTVSENARNMPARVDSFSGHTGVAFVPAKWASYIKINGKLKHLGQYTDIDDAIDARKAAEIAYGFHKNHGG